MYQIAAGYEDGNDSNTLRHEPIMKMAAGRLPVSGAPLASQPTISRFQNRPSRAQLYRMATCIVEQFIASYDEAPEIIVLDFDDTDSQTADVPSATAVSSSRSSTPTTTVSTPV